MSGRLARWDVGIGFGTGGLRTELIRSCDDSVVRDRDRRPSTQILPDERGAERRVHAAVAPRHNRRLLRTLMTAIAGGCRLRSAPSPAYQGGGLPDGQCHHDGEGDSSEHAILRRRQWQGLRQTSRRDLGPHFHS